MSTAILPDDSVVIRLARETIHLDAKTKAIHVRAAHPGRDLGGSILASYPLAAADRVRLTRHEGGRFWLFLDLKSGTTIGLGDAASQDVGMLTARVIADLTRCKVEVTQGEVRTLPGGGRALDEPTRRIPWEEVNTMTAKARAPSEPSEPETEPPEGWQPPGPREAPWARAAFEAIDAPRPTDEPEVPRNETPVFLELLRESQFEAALAPGLLDADLGLEQHSTQIGVGGWRGRSTSSTRLRAVVEMLRLMSENLPVARASLADFRLPTI